MNERSVAQARRAACNKNRTAMPHSSSQFAEYVVHDLLGHLPGITSRAMFGGYGIYADGVVFAVIADGRLFMKVDDTNRGDYQAAGSVPFTYSTKDGGKSTMGYWELPESIAEQRPLLTAWVQKSLAVARSAKQKKSLKKGK
jgi:DNA transformation protein